MKNKIYIILVVIIVVGFILWLNGFFGDFVDGWNSVGC